MSNFSNKEIVNACVHNLSGSCFRSCLHISDETDRILDRSIGTQYDCSLLPSLQKEKVIDLSACEGIVTYKEGETEGHILYGASNVAGERWYAG